MEKINKRNIKEPKKFYERSEFEATTSNDEVDGIASSSVINGFHVTSTSGLAPTRKGRHSFHAAVTADNEEIPRSTTRAAEDSNAPTETTSTEDNSEASSSTASGKSQEAVKIPVIET